MNRALVIGVEKLAVAAETAIFKGICMDHLFWQKKDIGLIIFLTDHKFPVPDQDF